MPKDKVKLTIPISEKLMLRIDEAAAISGLSRSTIYLLMASGDLQTLKVRGRRLIPIGEIHRLAALAA